MKKTIAGLERENADLRDLISRQREENSVLKARVIVYEQDRIWLTTMVIGLEKITDCVAHTLTELKRKGG